MHFPPRSSLVNHFCFSNQLGPTACSIFHVPVVRILQLHIAVSAQDAARELLVKGSFHRLAWPSTYQALFIPLEKHETGKPALLLFVTV
jgi:hypothetical protein